MIEHFNHKYDGFFEERKCQARWERLKAIYSEDYRSFRVLFVVETVALLHKWREPTPAELKSILHYKLRGGKIAVRIGDVIDLFQPVWPLEIAKYEYMVHRATWSSSFRRRYFMTSIRSYATAVVQTWWAFETLMNDFAGIIAKERHGSLGSATLSMLEERRHTIDKAGKVVIDEYYQPILPRVQFIYNVLTGEPLDRGGKVWRALVELKNARDAYVHRVGKQKDRGSPGWDDAVIVDGFAAVRSTLGQILTKAPEFAARFVYRYLAFWSCGLESPFIWDGKEGDRFYLGLGEINPSAVVRLFAPMPGSFRAAKAMPPSGATRRPKHRGTGAGAKDRERRS